MKSLKELREHNNLKSKEVAEHIGVSARVYAYYEKGRTLPAKYVKPLANLFGISCDEFLDNLQDERVWHKEFGCIERTERLVLPTWEEFKNKKIKQVCFIGGDTICFYELYEDTKNNRLILLDHDCVYEYFNEPLTKENYTLACRKAKELFLGEKK